jgi:hypothetical protein
VAAWRKVENAAEVAGALLELGQIRPLKGDAEGAKSALQESFNLFQQRRDSRREAARAKRARAKQTGAAIAVNGLHP